MKKTTGNKSQKIPIGDTEDCYLLVNFDWDVIKHPKRTEDFHGSHEFSEDEVNYKIISMEIHFANKFYMYVTNYVLNQSQESAIENLLSILD